MNTEMPVQVDGEPWIQTPGEVVVSKSALKVRLRWFSLAKISNRMKLLISVIH